MSKILTAIGGLLILLSLGGIGVGIYKSFQAIHFNESAGIGAVGGAALSIAFLCCVVFFVGLMLLIIGLVMNAKRKSGPR
jgi:hypothetical protein